MAEKQGAIGRALRVALRSDLQLPRVEPRESGISQLMNPRRQKVYELVAREPGVHLRSAGRHLAIPTQSLRWHLRVMVRAGLLREVRLRGRAAYFCEGLTEAEDDPVFVCLQDGMNRRILENLLLDKALIQAVLIKRLGSYEQRVTPHLRWMEEAGLITGSWEHGRRVFRITPAVERLRRRYAESAEPRVTRLLQTLQRQGIAPKVAGRGATSLSVAVSSGRESATLRFELVPLKA